ncbi:MAG: hypothetical protein K6F34_01335, partial [Lachnospiraceae bacterium]|nr:hypothetical protein [Lachnospiraceae bacterium]
MFRGVSRKRFIQCIISMIIIAAVFTTTVAVLDRVLLIKSEDGIEQMKSFYLQPEGTVDALFVGSSHIFCHVNTGILWDEYGISGYDLAGAEQPFWNSYYYIKEALRYQTPKVIVLDITTPGIRPVDIQPENWFITNNYGIRYGKNRFDSIKASTLKQSFPRLLVPLNSTHGRYVDLTEEDFVENDCSVNYKGFDPRETIVAYETPDISGVTERGELSEKEEEYLRMIIDLVQGNGIPLLFISSPYVVTADEQAKYNTIFDIADEYGIPYLDYNKLYDEMGLDFETDIAEVLHLNRSGNGKFTRHLGKYLKDNYELTDHRGDDRYVSWDADALIQRQDNLKFDIEQAAKNGDSAEYLKLLSNDKYVVFCTIPAGYGGLSDASLLPAIEGLGLKMDMFKELGAFVLRSGKCAARSYDKDVKMTVADGARRLAFVRYTDENSDMMMNLVRVNGMRNGQSMKGYDNYSMPQDGLSFYVYDTVLDQAFGGYTIR